MRVFEFAEKYGFTYEEAVDVLKSALPDFVIADGLQELPAGFEQVEKVIFGAVQELVPNSRGFTWSVGNFKAFGLSQSVSFKPLTLVFGPNSGGKSSLLHSLLFFDHFYQSGELDFRFPRLTGDAVDLGGFRDITHGKNIEEAPVQFSFEVDSKQSRVSSHPRLPGVENIKVELTFQMPTTSEFLASVFDDLKVADEKHELIPRATKLAIEINHQSFWDITRKRDGSYGTSVINVEHGVFQSLVEALEENLVWNRQGAPAATVLIRGFLEQCFLEEYIRWHGTNLPFTGPQKTFLSVKASARGYMEKLRSEGVESPIDFITESDTISKKLDDFCSLLFDRIDNSLHERFSNLTYLGPIREIPDRYFAFLNRHDSNWQASGGEAWDMLRESQLSIEAVNKWLGNEKFLKTPYQIRKRVFLSTSSLRGPIEAACHEMNNVLEGEREDDLESFNERIKSFGALDADEFATDLIKELELNGEQPRFEDLVLFDVKKRITVGHRDVGVGISQLLPVLVYAMAYKQKTIAIEQPEIHVHPAIQSELGDVFIRSALGPNANNFIIETHSEHLILRILRRIRECSENDEEYPSDLPKIRPEDVAVLYVQPSPEGSRITELHITPDGDFRDKWPDGFFTERAKELF